MDEEELVVPLKTPFIESIRTYWDDMTRQQREMPEFHNIGQYSAGQYYMKPWASYDIAGNTGELYHPTYLSNEELYRGIADLMAKFILERDINEDICKNVDYKTCTKYNANNCAGCIKNYFEKMFIEKLSKEL